MLFQIGELKGKLKEMSREKERQRKKQAFLNRSSHAFTAPGTPARVKPGAQAEYTRSRPQPDDGMDAGEPPGYTTPTRAAQPPSAAPMQTPAPVPPAPAPPAPAPPRDERGVAPAHAAPAASQPPGASHTQQPAAPPAPSQQVPPAVP